MNAWHKLLYNLSDYLGIILREFALYIELQFYVKRKLTFIRYTLPFEKGLGKSYTLLKVALKYKIPIVVKTRKEKERLLENKIKYMELKGTPVILICDEIMDKHDILLIEEGLTITEINKLKELADAIIGYMLISNEKVEEN